MCMQEMDQLRHEVNQAWQRLRPKAELAGIVSDVEPVVFDTFADDPQCLQYAGDYVGSMRRIVSQEAGSQAPPDRMSLRLLALIADVEPTFIRSDEAQSDPEVVDYANSAVRALIESQLVPAPAAGPERSPAGNG